jgi:hypothetical protein
MKNHIFQLALCAAALLGGIVALLHWGVTPPPWLAGIEAALIMGVAMSYGFTARLPRIPWLALRPVRGAVLVVLGSIMVFIQPQLIVAAFLIARGIRLVWLSACQLADAETREAVGHYAAVVQCQTPAAYEAVGQRSVAPVAQQSIKGYLED